jgi:hypothetical protein
MYRAYEGPDSGAVAGVRIGHESGGRADDAVDRLCARLRDLGLLGHVDGPAIEHDGALALRVRAADAVAWSPCCDTLALADRLGLDGAARSADLEREVVLSLLLAPVALTFPSVDEFESAVRIRCDTAEAARRTVLDFDTDAIERPAHCWRYDPATGFTILPGHDLVDALRCATQPDESGRRYAFSCYRASEYVMLIALAKEARRCHPELFQRMQAQAERRAIQSGEFHEVFLREHGSMDAPLPSHWYVPGDRVWFRNPDSRSADVPGYEGSWVIYLGAGLFSNFWQRDRPFTLARKCVELHHWRDATRIGRDGRLYMDEDEVERRVAASFESPDAVAGILARMRRLREPRGVYRDGGCMDTTRESLRWVRPGTSDIVLPGR